MKRTLLKKLLDTVVQTEMNKTYPRVTIDLKKLRNNIDRTVEKCQAQGVHVAGIIKGCTGIPACVKEFDESQCKFIGSSRLEQLRDLHSQGVKKPLMLIRIPMMSELSDVIAITDISLNSEVETLKALNEEATKQGRFHRVILMVDLGDLREGFWDKTQLVETAKLVEKELASLELLGIGTNLGCYGSISATKEKMEELIACAEKIEGEIGRKLEYISGGGTTSLPRIFDEDMPERINLLRIGEGILLAKDLKDLWNYNMDYAYQNVFTVEAEIIEVKEKPSYPVGEILFDAFGNVQEYEDRGVRKRALLALGKVDYAFLDSIHPLDEAMEVIGASSDHTILDIENCQRNYKVGDVVQFNVSYAALVYVTNSPNVKIVTV